jgi:hypothetical protein
VYGALPPQKKKTSGCVVAIIVMGVISVLVLAAATIAFLLFLRSAPVKQVFGAVKEAQKQMEEAQHAPGTAELASLGCVGPMVMDADKMAAAMASIFDASTPTSKSGVSLIVVCPAGPGASRPSCDDVAQTYVKAVGRADKPFMAEVTERSGGGGAVCEKTYAADGTEAP